MSLGQTKKLQQQTRNEQIKKMRSRYTLQEIGDVLGLSRARISQILKQIDRQSEKMYNTNNQTQGDA